MPAGGVLHVSIIKQTTTPLSPMDHEQLSESREDFHLACGQGTGRFDTNLHLETDSAEPAEIQQKVGSRQRSYFL